MTELLSASSEAALDEAGTSVSDIANWLCDAITDNHDSNNNGVSLAEDWSQWMGITHVIEVYGMGPGNEGEWKDLWNDEIRAAVDAELDILMRQAIGSDFGERIASADNLDELTKWLKAVDEWAKSAGVDIESIYKPSELQTFDGDDSAAAGIYSWDDKRMLTFGPAGWQVVPRSDVAA